MKRLFAILVFAVTVIAGACLAFTADPVEVLAAATVEAPTATTKPGTYKVASFKTIKLKCATKGAKIYYSLNGAKYKRYTKGINLKKDSTIKCYAKKDGKKSEVVEFSYKIKITTKTANDKKTETDTAKKKTENTGLLGDYTNRTFYKLLDADRQKAYGMLYEGLASHSESIDLSSAGLPQSQMYALFEVVLGDCPELFYVDDSKLEWNYYSTGKTVAMVTPTYTNTESEVKTRQTKLEASSDKIIADAKASSKDTFEFVRAIHDKICTMTTYTEDTGELRDMAGTDDVLVDGKGLCTAYARAFAYLCLKSGIPCVMVTGQVRGDDGVWEGHAWNKVCLDGEWYVMDVCWDDPVTLDGSGIVVYKYFCVTDEVADKDHRSGVDRDSYLDIYKTGSAFGLDFGKSMECKATKYNYYEHYGITLYQNSSEAEMGIRTTLADNFANDIYVTTFYFKDASLCLHMKDECDMYIIRGALPSYMSYSYTISCTDNIMTIYIYVR